MYLEDELQRRALYEQFLRCIDREENLIHHRMTWGIQWNAAIVVAALGISKLDLIEPLETSMNVVLGLLGAMTGWLSHIGVKAASDQSKYLIEQLELRLKVPRYRDRSSRHELELDWESTEFIRPFGQQGTVHLPARNAAIKFPILFIGVWSIFVAYTVLKADDRLGWIKAPAAPASAEVAPQPKATPAALVPPGKP